jgi:ADP-heptose:LPS heptosyltransferase
MEDKQFLRLACPQAELIEASLAQAARLIAECEVFIGNDSGLVHLAGGLGVKVLAIFGMTDPVRAQPLGRSLSIHPSSCPPCFDEGRSDFSCVLGLDYKCIRQDISVQLVSTRVDSAFLQGPDPLVPSDSGPYRLYNKPVASDS